MTLARTQIKRAGIKPSQPKPPAGPRKRKCAVCRAPFEPRSMTHKACGAECAVVHGAKVAAAQKAKAQRQERAETKAKLQAIEPLEYWIKRAERAFNTFIRKRDEGQGCISCGRKNADVYNAGHFVSVGANRTLRFNEDNVHLQCARPCNKDKGGNIHEYRKALLIKIGADRLAILDGWHPPIKMTRQTAQAVEAEYSRKLKQLKESHGNS